MAILAPLLTPQFFNTQGTFNAGGFLASYQAGTSTPVATYTDSTGFFPNLNPTPLNARGECSVWVNPNVAYKFVLQDPTGATIWTRDNVIANQLITLYGGLDSGAVNAYLLNFTAAFSSYTDGTVIYWIPTNSNTGPSTLNVNNLGTLAILTISGTILPPNAIIAGQITQVVYRGGNFYLIATQGFISGTIPGASWSGFSAPFMPVITYRVNGSLVTWQVNGVAASNQTLFYVSSIPLALQSSIQQVVPVSGIVNNSTAMATGGAAFINGAVISFGADQSGTVNNWTPSGNKGFLNSMFTYTL